MITARSAAAKRTLFPLFFFLPSNTLGAIADDEPLAAPGWFAMIVASDHRSVHRDDDRRTTMFVRKIVFTRSGGTGLNDDAVCRSYDHRQYTLLQWSSETGSDRAIRSAQCIRS